MKAEIRSIDMMRWALLHLPFGILAGILLVVSAYQQASLQGQRGL